MIPPLEAPGSPEPPARRECDSRYPPIADYAIIGDSRTCALISRDGSVDWLCLPDFDSASLFARILDWDGGGYWRIAPADAYTVRRRYVGDTNILETTFITADGEAALIDFMPALTEDEKKVALQPMRALLRIVECRRGRMRLTSVFAPRPDYARGRPRFMTRTPRDVTMVSGAEAVHFRGDTTLVVDDSAVRADFEVQEGTRRRFSIAYSFGEPAVIVSDEYVDWAYERSVAYWTEWSSRCTYRGPYRDAVLRSALTLKLLAYAPSGAIVAAPTTSLPEQVGGPRNWDYRFCWLRDASFTVRAFIDLGLYDEAAAFNSWLLHATHLSAPRLSPLYTLLGEPNAKERELPHFEGYRRSRPVRVGNGAASQQQFDVYGELIYAVHVFATRLGEPLSHDEARFVRRLADHVAAHWREPDNGIWEQRLEPRHYTQSKVMAWVALSRAADLAEQGRLTGDTACWRREAAAIRALVLSDGYNNTLGAFTQTLSGTALDAAVLTLPLVGFISAKDPKMLSTIAALQRSLAHNGMLRRYAVEDGLPGGEGAFVICNFWLAAALAHAGSDDKARAIFEATLAARNDLGLMSEEVVPETWELLGNFPQAFSHIGLIVAALAMEHALAD